MNKVELLAPAGDLEKLKIAILYGADAVFIGGLHFSLRSRASNFTLEDIKEGCDFAHKHNAKVHVTCNILPHEIDCDGVREYLHSLEECGVDAIICASPLIIEEALKTNMEVHVSTQESTLNSSMVKFYESMGVDRVVLGRELDLKSIKEIKDNCKVDIEAFIHGGMCVSYSGRCMLSNNMTGRDANRGGCAHSCRWNYDLVVDNEKKNNNGQYFAMSSKDLCAIRDIPSLILSGANSFKIEGRMKSLHYIATVVKAYRMIIDEYYETGSVKDFDFYDNEIRKAENRETSYGFLHGETDVSEQLYNMRSEEPSQTFCGIVKSYDTINHMAYVESRNFFKPNSKLELFGPKLSKVIEIKEIYDKDDNILDASRHPGDIIHFKCDIPLSEWDMVRIYED